MFSCGVLQALGFYSYPLGDPGTDTGGEINPGKEFYSTWRCCTNAFYDFNPNFRELFQVQLLAATLAASRSFSPV